MWPDVTVNVVSCEASVLIQPRRFMFTPAVDSWRRSFADTLAVTAPEQRGRSWATADVPTTALARPIANTNPFIGTLPLVELSQCPSAVGRISPTWRTLVSSSWSAASSCEFLSIQPTHLERYATVAWLTTRIAFVNAQ